MSTIKLFAAGALIAMTVVVSSSVAFAIDATNSPVLKRNETIRENNEEFRSEVKDTIKMATKPGEMRGEVRELNKERMASNSAARQLYRSERAKVHGERLDLRFSFYAERLNNIAARIQTRIDTEKAAGKDVATAQTALDKAKTLISTAVADGKTAVSMFQNISITVWSTQAPEVKAAIVQANKARGEFVQARLSLIDATAAL